MVRSHIDIVAQCGQHIKKEILRCWKECKNGLLRCCLSYTDRLKVYKLPTLHNREILGDMIEVYKIITGKYEGAVAARLESDDMSVTRSNELGLKKFRPRYDLRKYSFTNRVVNILNNLPNKVVLADAVNCFKSRLDKFRQNQDIVYNFRAEIEGTRNRSEV